MASIFPAGIDTTITLPQVVEGITPLNGTIFNQLRDTVIYIESNIGVNAGGIYGTIRNRLDTLEQLITSGGGGGGGSGTPTGPAYGDLGGNYPAPIVIRLHGNPIGNDTATGIDSSHPIRTWAQLIQRVPGGKELPDRLIPIRDKTK
jgi:hypothetical protein